MFNLRRVLCWLIILGLSAIATCTTMVVKSIRTHPISFLPEAAISTSRAHSQPEKIQHAYTTNNGSRLVFCSRGFRSNTGLAGPKKRTSPTGDVAMYRVIAYHACKHTYDTPPCWFPNMVAPKGRALIKARPLNLWREATRVAQTGESKWWQVVFINADTTKII